MLTTLKSNTAHLVALIALSTISFLTLPPPEARAEVGKVHKQTTTITTQESDEEPSPTPTEAPKQDRDYLVQKVFGSKAESGTDGCKTDDLAEKTKLDLLHECKLWTKEQKAELGSKFQTGTCNDECDDCGMSLKRCRVRGVVHYAK